MAESRVRQRKGGAKEGTPAGVNAVPAEKEKFSKHVQEENARRAAVEAKEAAPAENNGITAVGKVMLYLALPTTVGFFGLVMAYVTNDPEKGKRRSVDFDTDFVFPFLLTLTCIIVIGFKTKNFTGEPTPLVAWPKVKKQKKVMVRRVIVEDEDIVDASGDQNGKTDSKGSNPPRRGKKSN
uniref:Transmembrane protein n=1 Tax=Attheya septentrionalis TaxID=420275 RepID=A0A7S2XS04_9STRA|mmetsp:Transcript_24426/g.44177  ORF Transcript_24426/g.44177 Transcript_24426/m.44177 type:complete len:181 (+) Transcript_24426:159-701(+)|eukprot:CAMPEP_0198281104 /NCGR_PEP_ID=MMETSP1449-20131203/1101_1 /TAXON_ID=420275 /ORGANISM="Attheya septentrionalis, Strain CCMP2084" /LENGTH=180 /DNA_ID=CAMNT_0043976739 /DNA_START=157 /DNA_END=699 /DNA_ORIENTATION=-